MKNNLDELKELEASLGKLGKLRAAFGKTKELFDELKELNHKMAEGYKAWIVELQLELAGIKKRLNGMLHQGEIEQDQFNYILGAKHEKNNKRL